MFEDYEDVCDHKSVMDVNFRGSVYCTQFAIPHLKQSRGKIIVISSVLGWSNCPKLSIYGATKAALISFFETLRVEVGSEIGITIVTPGLVDSEITDNKFMSKWNLWQWSLWKIYWKIFCPELMEWFTGLVLVSLAKLKPATSITSICQ
ncbi:11-beta-hydroxysteroid dehydrogenase A-like isoform X2 [Apium graveolens]|uniref:11-beta-hydroxysteroid dehydrogenase A-like isoform X2 n=1 Tax=Apium graveolens TaxID=4045 RepID=UPI003D7AFE2A